MEPTSEQEPPLPSVRRAWLVFTAGRVGLFVMAAALIFLGTSLAGHPLDALPLLFAALVVSSLVAFVAFRRQRDLLALSLDRRRRQRVDENAARRARLEGS